MFVPSGFLTQMNAAFGFSRRVAVVIGERQRRRPRSRAADRREEGAPRHVLGEDHVVLPQHEDCEEVVVPPPRAVVPSVLTTTRNGVVPQLAARWNGKFAKEPDRSIVATRRCAASSRAPRRSRREPSRASRWSHPTAAVKTQLETSLSKWTLYTPFVTRRAESACFHARARPALADDRELRRRAAVARRGGTESRQARPFAGSTPGCRATPVPHTARHRHGRRGGDEASCRIARVRNVGAPVHVRRERRDVDARLGWVTAVTPFPRTSVPLPCTTTQFLAACAVAGSASPMKAAPAMTAVRNDRLLNMIPPPDPSACGVRREYVKSRQVRPVLRLTSGEPPG